MARRTEPGEEFALFPRPPEAPLPPAKTRPAVTSARPKWEKYNAVNRLPCDECKQAQVRGEMETAAMLAHFRRRAGASDLLLCYVHARQWRTADGMDIPKSMRPQ